MSKELRSSRIFYGWFIVAACFAVTLTLGEAFWTFGVFVKPLENEFGWSRTLISSGYTALLIGYAACLLVSGRFVDRLKPRPILFASAILSGLGIALCSQVQSINQFRFFLFVAGLGAGATWSVPNATVQRWFYHREKAGLALAIVVAGVGVGALIFTPLVNHLILTYNWRTAYLIIGVLFFVIIFISALVIKPSPAGIRATAGEEKSTSKPEATRGRAKGNRILATPTFLAITLVVSAGVLSFQVMSVHLVPYAIDVGVSPTAAAAAFGLLGGFSIPGRFLGGFLSSRLGWQKVLVFSLIAAVLPLFWLLFLENTWMLYVFVFFYGLCHGTRIPAQVGILGEFFGMRSLGELIGITAAVAQIAGGLAPYVAGFIFDTTGSYFWAFIMVIMVLLVTGAIGLLIRRPASPED